MRITCPECGYSREIDDSKIPAKSVKATCPKCQTKFRFRGETPQFDIEPPAETYTEPHVEQQAAAPTPEGADEAAPEHAAPSEDRRAERVEAEKEDDAWQSLYDRDHEPRTEPRDSQEHESHDEYGREAVSDNESEPEPEHEPSAAQKPEESESKPRPRRIVMEDEPSDEDIWQRLENMGAGTGKSDSGRTSFTNHEFSEEEEPSMAEVPWERLDVYGFFGGLFQTIKRSMLAPGLFFSAMPVGRGLGLPLVFFILVSEFQAICQLMWHYLGLDPLMTIGGQVPQQDPAALEFGAGSLMILLIYPVLFTIWLFIMSGVIHLLLRIFGSGAAGFEGTFRVLSYSAAPSVLAIIPYAGAFAGGFWSLVIMFIGLKSIHSTNFVRVLFAFLLPLIIIIALAVSLTSMQPGATPNMY